MTLEFGLFVLVGFVGELVDAAVGMGFGVITTSVLLAFGMPPAEASASVHICKIVTGCMSGGSHLYLRNFDRQILYRLATAGAGGGVLGAYILTEIPGDVIRPFIAVYLLLMGFIILRRLRQSAVPGLRPLSVGPLALAGGFLDAVGGGGWGPIVTSTLVARGVSPRIAVGSVNIAEVVVALAASTAFVIIIGSVHWEVIAGILTGGVVSAPIGAYLTRRLPMPLLKTFVAVSIILISTYGLTRVFL
jgi:uncharacterized membrane protein YfcA